MPLWLTSGPSFRKYSGSERRLPTSACYTLSQMPTQARDQLFEEFFDPSQMGLSVCRICIGSSDYARDVYSFDEGEPDPELKRFSINHNRAYILPVLQSARKVNPDLYLLASPWSPPGWMKPNNSMLGGCAHPLAFPAYARYFVKFLQDYSAAGVPVNAVTVQNEVDTEQNGRMPACLFGQEYEMGFVADHLGPEFAILQCHSTGRFTDVLDLGVVSLFREQPATEVRMTFCDQCERRQSD